MIPESAIHPTNLPSEDATVSPEGSCLISEASWCLDFPASYSSDEIRSKCGNIKVNVNSVQNSVVTTSTIVAAFAPTSCPKAQLQGSCTYLARGAQGEDVGTIGRYYPSKVSVSSGGMVSTPLMIFCDSPNTYTPAPGNYSCPDPTTLNGCPSTSGDWRNNGSHSTTHGCDNQDFDNTGPVSNSDGCADLADLGGGHFQLLCCYTGSVYYRVVTATSCTKTTYHSFSCE